MLSVLGTDSRYAVHKMMMLSEKVRPYDPKKRGVVVPTKAAATNTKRLGARNARNVASSSPRQLHHRVIPSPAVDLSPESSSIASVCLTSRHKSTFTASVETGTTVCAYSSFVLT